MLAVLVCQLIVHVQVRVAAADCCLLHAPAMVMVAERRNQALYNVEAVDDCGDACDTGHGQKICVL